MPSRHIFSQCGKSRDQGGTGSNEAVRGLEACPYKGVHLLFCLLCREDVGLLSQLRALRLKGRPAPGALCLRCRRGGRAALGRILAALACEEAAQEAPPLISHL